MFIINIYVINIYILVQSSVRASLLLLLSFVAVIMSGRKVAFWYAKPYGRNMEPLLGFSNFLFDPKVIERAGPAGDVEAMKQDITNQTVSTDLQHHSILKIEWETPKRNVIVTKFTLPRIAIDQVQYFKIQFSKRDSHQQQQHEAKRQYQLQRQQQYQLQQQQNELKQQHHAQPQQQHHGQPRQLSLAMY